MDSEGRPETWRELRASMTRRHWGNLMRLLTMLVVTAVAVLAPVVALAWSLLPWH